MVAKFVALLSLCFALVLATAPRSQVEIKFVHPEKFERATKADDKGMTQWDEHVKTPCPTCNGKLKTKCSTCERFAEDAVACVECKRNKELEAMCRACAGTGAFPDPLEKVSCPGCHGAGFLVCMICGGGGRLKVGKAKEWSACPGCRSDGGFACTVCSGKRLVEVAGCKPSLKEANSVALGKALTATDLCLKELIAIVPTGGEKVRKEVKAMVKALEAGQGVFPAIKRLPKAFEDYMSKTYSGSQFQGDETNNAEAINLVKGNAEYFLKHQKRMLELCLKRAELNEKLAAENKGK